MKVSISECEITDDDRLLFRGRRWVPASEPLRTRILQDTHDSPMVGHPGHNTLYAIIARSYFWPQMSSDIRRFTRNCDKCGVNAIWRHRRQGLLKPLPIPERKWREISMDFVDKLPGSDGCISIIVIRDRLGKGLIIELMESMETEYVARKFIKVFYAAHGFPEGIVSDRGSQFISELWTTVCQLMKVKRRLSTAWHPETDGSTERSNQEIEHFLRLFVEYAQGDWAFLCSAAQLALNNHDCSTTGVSPFFLDHGFHMDPLDFDSPPTVNDPKTPK